MGEATCRECAAYRRERDEARGALDALALAREQDRTRLEGLLARAVKTGEDWRMRLDGVWMCATEDQPEGGDVKMAKAAVGERVGVLVGIFADREKVVGVLGAGVREPDAVPGPEAAGMLADVLRGAGQENPQLLLDTGERVWGCEVWWCSLAAYEADVAELVEAGFAVETMTVAQLRARAIS